MFCSCFVVSWCVSDDDVVCFDLVGGSEIDDRTWTRAVYKRRANVRQRRLKHEKQNQIVGYQKKRRNCAFVYE
jgi:hypothetical protein